MPLKLQVGLSQKIGLPNYSSLGASCSIECEVDGSLATADLVQLRTQAEAAYQTCAALVRAELDRQQPANSNGRLSQRTSLNGSGSNGTTAAASSPCERASNRQLDFIRKLVNEIEPLEWKQLDGVALDLFGVPLLQLSRKQASELIDTLKQVASGRLDLASLLLEVDR